jgi:hypothetical protein
MSDCQCGGDGYYLEPNYRTEVMEWVQCIPCLADEQLREQLFIETAKLVSRFSHEKLASLLSGIVLDRFDNEGNILRLQEIVEGKDFTTLSAFIEVHLR